MSPVPQSTSIRPPVVTAAAVIQFVLAGLSLLGGILALTYGADIEAGIRADLESQGAAPDLVDQVANGGNDPVSLGVVAVSAVVLVALAVFNLKGRNGSRITTWVVAGILLLCNLLGAALSTMFSGGGDTDLDVAGAMQAGYAAAADWYAGYISATGIASLIGYLAVVILLAVPAANRYFRPARPDVALPPEAG